jgi:nicotinic acid mononucleotide adenylyltransferase
MGLMKNYRQLIKELPSKTVVFAFGRFNPPTIGHELLVRAVRKLAQQRKADHVIYASASHDAKKNPLDVTKKVGYLRLMFPNTNFMAAGGDERTFIEAAKALNKRYKNIIMIAGSDRVPAFKKLLNDYNGKDFKFDTIEVVSAGERDPDADDATGMSASKMRTLATKGDYRQFKRGLPTTIRDIDGRRLMNDIRQGMGLEVVKEQLNLVKDNLREKYFRGEVFKLDDIVESAGAVYKIVKRGSNHLLLEDETGTRVTKWIQDVSETEKAFMLQEDLTDKTLKVNTDKIKVARIIATMLGIDNAESMANPEALVNLALRKARQKALNPEALKIVAKMLSLADEVGIKYDDNLKPQKLKEASGPAITGAVTIDTSLEPKKKKKVVAEDTATTAATARTAARQSKIADLMAKHADEKESLLNRQKKEQERVRDQINVREEVKDNGIVDKKSNYNLARSIMRYSDFKKSIGMMKQEVTPDDNRETESDHDATIGDNAEPHTHVGQVAHNKSHDSNLRRRKVKYHLGEETEEQADDREEQVKRFKKQADESELTKEEYSPETYGSGEVEIVSGDIHADMNDNDIEDVIDALTDDDYLEVYDDEELSIVDAETGEECEECDEEKAMNEQLVLEVLSRMERMRAKIRIRKTAAKRQRAEKIALKRYSDMKTINKRARRLAIKLMKKRMLRGRDVKKMSVPEKERLERFIEKRKDVVGRIATRLAPRIRKLEKNRLSHGKFTVGATPSVF